MSGTTVLLAIAGILGLVWLIVGDAAMWNGTLASIKFCLLIAFSWATVMAALWIIWRTFRIK